MSRKAYPNDLTDADWQWVLPLIPLAHPGRNKYSVNLPEIVNKLHSPKLKEYTQHYLNVHRSKAYQQGLIFLSGSLLSLSGTILSPLPASSASMGGSRWLSQVPEPPKPSQSKPTKPAAIPEPEMAIAEVVVTGISNPELEAAVRKAIATQPGRTITRSQLQQDINAIFALGWVKSTRAVPEDTPRGVRVTFIIEINPVLGRVAVSGSTVLTQTVVQQSFAEQFGHLINFHRLDAGIKKLETWYQNNGYVLARVIAPPEISADGTVTLKLIEGEVEEIQVQQIDATNPAKPANREDVSQVLQTLTEVRAGRPFNRQAVERDIKSLLQAGFTDVRIGLKVGREPRRAIVIFRVSRTPNPGSLVAQAGSLVNKNTAEAKQEAIAKYEQAIQLYGQQNQWQQQATLMRYVGRLLSQDIEALLQELQQNQPASAGRTTVLQQQPDDLLGLNSLVRLIELAKVSSDPKVVAKQKELAAKQEKAVGYFKQALALSQQRNDRWTEALELYNIGYHYRKWRQPELAVAFLNQVVTLSRSLPEARARWLEIAAWNELGQAHQALGDPPSALNAFKQVLLQFRTLDRNLPDALAALPIEDRSFYVGFGLSSRTGLSYEWSLLIEPEDKILRSKSNKPTETSNSSFFNNLSNRHIKSILTGIALLKIGQIHKTLKQENLQQQFFQEALQLFKEETAMPSGVPRLETVIFLVAASVANTELEDPSQAIANYREIIAIARKANLPEVAGALQLVVAAAQAKLQNAPLDAIASLADASTLIEEVKRPEFAAPLLVSSAWLYGALGQKSQALVALNRALAAIERVKQPTIAGMMMLGTAWVSHELDQDSQAIATLKTAQLQIAQVQKPEYAIPLLYVEAWLFQELGQSQLAKVSADRAQESLASVKDRALFIPLLLAQAWVEGKLSRSQQAQIAMQRALKQIKAIEHPMLSGILLWGWMGVYTELYKQQGWQVALQNAFSAARTEASSTQQQWLILLLNFTPDLLANSHWQLGANVAEVMGNYYLTSLNDPVQALNFLAKVPKIYQNAGKPRQAIAHFEPMLRLHRQLGQVREEAILLYSSGQVYQELGEYQQAINAFNQASEILQQTQNFDEAVKVLLTIANFYANLGDFQPALQYYKQAQEMTQRLKNLGQEADIWVALGQLYRKSGDFEKAIESYQQARSRLAEFSQTPSFQQVQALQKTLASSSDNPMLVQQISLQAETDATILAKMSLVYADLGQKEQAISTFRQSVELAKDISEGTQHQLLFQGAILYDALGEPEVAIRYAKQAQSLSPSKVAVVGISNAAEVLTFLGKLHAQLGQTSQALDYYNQALRLAKKSDRSSTVADTLYKIARVERDGGNLTRALNHLQAALELVESLRRRIAGSELKASYFATVQDYYELYIDVLMQLHRQRPSEGFDRVALHASERARARSLLELLAEARADLRQGAAPELLERERTLQQQFQTLEERRLQLLASGSAPEQRSAVEQRQEQVLQEYRELRAKLRAASSRYADLTQPEPLTLPEIQQKVLDGNTILLQYSLGESRSYLWAVTSTEITAYELPKRAEIEVAAQNFQKVLTAELYRNNPSQILEASEALSQLILQPVAGKLQQKRLLIIPDGWLNNIPFSALVQPKTPGESSSSPLIANHEILTLPSASTLAILRQNYGDRKQAAQLLAILADPVFSPQDERVSGRLAPKTTQQLEVNDISLNELARAFNDIAWPPNRLRFSRQEAQAIARLIPSNSSVEKLDFSANRVAATDGSLADYQIIHFATHGFANRKNPELSGIVLSLVDESGNLVNGFLRLPDIFNLRLSAKLVVLSACQTGLGQNMKGEGIIGLTRGFMYAGAQRVLVSLWNVDDEGTSIFMQKFYQKMLQENLAPVAALRAAQLEMLQQPEWSSPYYWSAFTLQGEWK